MAEMIERTTALIAWHAGRAAPVAETMRGLGLDLPDIGRFIEAGGLMLARVAPHQVLAMRVGVDLPLMEELQSLKHGSGLIDLSDSRVGVRVAGPAARENLRRLVPLDLHPARFGPGSCAQTLVAHLSVLVLQTGPDAFELQCGRSFADSFLRAVEAACGYAKA